MDDILDRLTSMAFTMRQVGNDAWATDCEIAAQEIRRLRTDFAEADKGWAAACEHNRRATSDVEYLRGQVARLTGVALEAESRANDLAIELAEARL